MVAGAETAGSSPNQEPDTLHNEIMAAIERVRPALVRIHVVTTEDETGREVKREAVGSGVIITQDGHVITNHHVAGRGIRFVCTLSNKAELDAELIGTDPLSDISVIKLRNESARAFAYAEFGNSDILKVGDRVLAMGSPLAFSQSVTMGIVSNAELIIPEFLQPYASVTLEGEDVGSIVRWIGHDAPIYPGNSGGPLVSMDGKVIGINEINLGISGAIPGNLAKKIAEELIQTGKVTRSWFGMEVQPLLKHSGRQKRGVLISGTIDGSPARRVGLLSGDILLSVAGKEVNVQFAEELPLFNQLIMACTVGKEVEVGFLRNDKAMVLRVVPQEREYYDPKAIEMKQWGIVVRNISVLAAKEMKRKDQKGVLITSVRPGGPCGEARPNMMSDDIIIAVNGNEIKNIADLKEATASLVSRAKEPVPLLVLFERGTEQYLSVVKIGDEIVAEQGQEFRKPWLGIAAQVLSRELAKALAIADHQGVRVTQVYEHTEAARSGIKVGDIIVALDGKLIQATDPADVEVLSTMLRKYNIGSSAELTVRRDGKESKITVSLEPTPKLPREMKKYRDENFELTVRDIAFTDRIDQQWTEDQQGALIEDVSTGSWAGLANLFAGDLIININAKPVADVEAFEKALKEIAANKPKSVVFHIMRGIHNLFVELEPLWDATE